MNVCPKLQLRLKARQSLNKLLRLKLSGTPGQKFEYKMAFLYLQDSVSASNGVYFRKI
jgi:hypothetical protein